MITLVKHAWRHQHIPASVTSKQGEELCDLVNSWLEKSVGNTLQNLFRPLLRTLCDETLDHKRFVSYLNSLKLLEYSEHYLRDPRPTVTKVDILAEVYPKVFLKNDITCLVAAWERSGNQHIISTVLEHLTDNYLVPREFLPAVSVVVYTPANPAGTPAVPREENIAFVQPSEAQVGENIPDDERSRHKCLSVKTKTIVLIVMTVVMVIAMGVLVWAVISMLESNRSRYALDYMEDIPVRNPKFDSIEELKAPQSKKGFHVRVTSEESSVDGDSWTNWVVANPDLIQAVTLEGNFVAAEINYLVSLFQNIRYLQFQSDAPLCDQSNLDNLTGLLPLPNHFQHIIAITIVGEPTCNPIFSVLDKMYFNMPKLYRVVFCHH